MPLHEQNVIIKNVFFTPPWTNHIHSHSWSNKFKMTNTALPIRWACPRMPVPAPAAPLHTGQSDFHPARTPITKAYFSKEYLVNSTCIKKRLNKNVLSLFSYENPMKDFDYFLLNLFQLLQQSQFPNWIWRRMNLKKPAICVYIWRQGWTWLGNRSKQKKCVCWAASDRDKWLPHLCSEGETKVMFVNPFSFGPSLRTETQYSGTLG